ncbi:SAICAR synthase-like protein [Mycena floridula]|nr:SAICAR synthase-like protein [Mycena floridula]
MTTSVLPMQRRSPSPLSTVDPYRQSLISASSLVSSSSTSFRTAPMATPSSSSLSISSSIHTLGPESGTNPIHTLAATVQQHPRQEVHIVKVTGDKVVLEQTTAVTDSFLKLVTPNHQHRGEEQEYVGPLPPSPPASLHSRDEKGSYFSQPEPQILYSEPEQVRDRLTSTSSSATARIAPVRALSHGGVVTTERASIDTKCSSHDTTRSGTTRMNDSAESQPTTQSIEQAAAVTLSAPGVPGSSKHSSDYLQPPPVSMHNPRPTRRATTGSSFSRLGNKTRSSLHTQHGSQPSAFDEPALDDMASDIQLHAEQIRRERMEKRVKQQQIAEAEAALTRADGGKKMEEVPLVGNLIGEDHVNYVLMYNMLTGIRIGVSRCQAKVKRPLTDDDFTAQHKFSFDIVGNELTPSAKYDFKFKDYAPWVFRSLREDYFHLDPADYLLSLTSKYILSELGSPGKSGSFFYFSRDYRFIIKTIHHSEHKFLLRVLKDYYNHVKDNPHTLLSRFYGLHRVKLPRGRKIHFVIMNNLFPAHKDIHETYDLKGSTIGREFPEEEGKKDNPVLKDLNWINKNKTLELGPEKRALLTEQLRRDKELLKKIYVMDYSLLVGIHNMRRGNRDNVRRNTLKVFEPEIPNRRHLNTASRSKTFKGGTSPEAIAVRRAMRDSDVKRFGRGTVRLPEQDTGDRQHFIFYQDDGGLQATDENNEEMDTIYYLGVIDILTPYGGKKKLEHLWKGLQADRHKISPVPPDEYAERFFAFMKAVMRGGGGGESFKP